MRQFLVHKDGEILRVGYCTDTTIDLQAMPGEKSMECFGDILPETHFIDEDEVVSLRPSLSPVEGKLEINADGIDAVVFDAFPLGTEVRINDVDYGTISDGSLEFTSQTPGIYRIHLLPPFPILEQIVEVTVNEN